MDDFNKPHMANNVESTVGPGQFKRFPFPGERQGPSQLQILEDLIVDLDKAMNMDAVYHCMQKVRFLSAEIQSRGR